MKLLWSAALASALLLGACASSYGYHGGYASNDFVDGYYDDFYGPFDDGYWGDDGVFNYRGHDHVFHRDDAGHFRHDGGGGGAFHSFHSHAAHGGEHPGGHG